MPTEHEFTRSLGFSRVTVRKALAKLRAEGVISSHRGSGTVVQHDPRGPMTPTVARLAGKTIGWILRLPLQRDSHPELFSEQIIGHFEVLAQAAGAKVEYL